MHFSSFLHFSLYTVWGLKNKLNAVCENFLKERETGWKENLNNGEIP